MKGLSTGNVGKPKNLDFETLRFVNPLPILPFSLEPGISYLSCYFVSYPVNSFQFYSCLVRNFSIRLEFFNLFRFSSRAINCSKFTESFLIFSSGKWGKSIWENN
jgi:hypothetical protein